MLPVLNKRIRLKLITFVKKDLKNSSIYKYYTDKDGKLGDFEVIFDQISLGGKSRYLEFEGCTTHSPSQPFLVNVTMDTLPGWLL